MDASLSALVIEVERRIQNLLLDLMAETGRSIDCVHIDTRNFANMKVEILFKDGERTS